MQIKKLKEILSNTEFESAIKLARLAQSGFDIQDMLIDDEIIKDNVLKILFAMDILKEYDCGEGRTRLKILNQKIVDRLAFELLEGEVNTTDCTDCTDCTYCDKSKELYDTNKEVANNSIRLSKEDITFLKELQHEMLTQDTVCQAAPRYWAIRGKTNVYGLDTKCSEFEGIRIDFETFLHDMEDVYNYLDDHYDQYEYHLTDGDLSYSLKTDNDFKSISDMSDALEHLKELGEDEAEIVGYNEEYEIYPDTFFLTNRACKEHIKQNYYHYSNDAHSYAMTAWRSAEVERLWRILDKINWSEIEKLVLKGGEQNGNA